MRRAGRFKTSRKNRRRSPSPYGGARIKYFRHSTKSFCILKGLSSTTPDLCVRQRTASYPSLFLLRMKGRRGAGSEILSLFNRKKRLHGWRPGIFRLCYMQTSRPPPAGCDRKTAKPPPSLLPLAPHGPPTVPLGPGIMVMPRSSLATAINDFACCRITPLTSFL